MDSLVVLAVSVLAVAIPVWLLFIRPTARKLKLARRAFPSNWAALLQTRWPLYRRLSEAERIHLHRLILLFLDEKEFYGCNGFTLSDQVRVLIAAQACLLVLEQRLDAYAGLQSILVYPGAFRNRQTRHDGAGVVHQEMSVRLGESWGTGRIVLSWEDVLAGLADDSDSNVVFHEFAHQLDQADGLSDGTPILSSRAQVQRWVAVCKREFERLRLDSHYGLPTVMDSYGAVNEAEFFAVATETFYLSPQRLAEHSPALFAELLAYFRHDPRRWQPHL